MFSHGRVRIAQQHRRRDEIVRLRGKQGLHSLVQLLRQGSVGMIASTGQESH